MPMLGRSRSLLFPDVNAGHGLQNLIDIGSDFESQLL